jgi:hypothetical protein
VVALGEPDVLAAYQSKLILVRPDGHVAWRADSQPSNAHALIDTVRGQSAQLRQQQAGRSP